MIKNLVLVFLIILAPILLYSQLVSQWLTTIERSSGNSYIELDSNEDIIFVGGNKVVKFDPFGNEIWRKDLSGEAYLGTNELPFDHLAIDELDNIYVLHNRWNGIYGEDEERIVLVSKYSSNGNELWTNEFIQESENVLSQGASVSFYNDKVFICGSLRESAVIIDGFVLCLSAITGEEEWRKSSINDGYICKGKRVRVDSEGYVYNAGYGDGNNVYCIIKYDSDGEYIWNVEYQIESDSISMLMDMAISNNDEIILTGHSFNTVSFDDLGNFLWYTMPPSNLPANTASDRAHKIFPLEDGSSIITGYHTEVYASNFFDSDIDAYTIKIDNSGNIIWSYRHELGEDNTQFSYSIDQDVDGDIIIVGTELIGLNTYKFLINKYSNENGSLLWSFLDTETESVGLQPSIQISSNSEVYVTGKIWEENEPQFIVKKYTTSLTSTDQLFHSPQTVVVYPNPSVNNTFRVYLPGVTTTFDIDIIDSRGKNIYHKRNYSNGEPIELIDVPSGMYYITIISEDNVTTKNIIID